MTRTVNAFLAVLVGALFTLPPTAEAQNHPSLFITSDEARDVAAAADDYPLLGMSVASAKSAMEDAFAHGIEVPPPGEAGGYEHERHKDNYREMRWAGLLFQITGEEKYAEFVRDMLDVYAEVYPTLGPHPLAHHQKAGKLFHQTLNEEVWLVHTSIAYDCVYDWLPAERRERYETNIFRPMAEWFSVRNVEEFDRIHNHGTWAVASVGMIGIVMGEDSYVEKALHGSNLDNEGGFLRQLDLLFSPDGYYMEGPYYIRYALMPFFYFAEAIHRNRPDVQIYEYRDQILKKALYSAVQTAYPNGVLPPINDASRTMDIAASEVVLAADLAYDRYGANDNLLGVAEIQGRVILNRSGLEVAKDHAAHDGTPKMTWPSVEFLDGNDGEQGGLGILRMGEGQDQTMLLMKYGVHGKGHGHFDKLHFTFFDQGREVVPDYGFARWINIEPKWGGRYLPENDSYAMQTIAHNTVVVDETTQNEFVESDAMSMSGKRHFFDASKDHVKAVSARADTYYDGVDMQRSMLMVDDDRLEYPVVVDLYRLSSDEEHTYDYPLHFRGQHMLMNFEIDADDQAQAPLGDDYGYQHVWKEAEGETDEPVRFTWLDGNRYYTFVFSAAPDTKILFGRTGANDPQFNLISEPMLVVRRTGVDDELFASVVEPHGYFNEARERSIGARGKIESVRVIGHNDEASVVEVVGKDGWSWTVMVNNGAPSETASHSVTFDGTSYSWTGNYDVRFE